MSVYLPVYRLSSIVYRLSSIVYARAGWECIYLHSFEKANERASERTRNCCPTVNQSSKRSSMVAIVDLIGNGEWLSLNVLKTRALVVGSQLKIKKIVHKTVDHLRFFLNWWLSSWLKCRPDEVGISGCDVMIDRRGVWVLKRVGDQNSISLLANILRTYQSFSSCWVFEICQKIFTTPRLLWHSYKISFGQLCKW